MEQRLNYAKLSPEPRKAGETFYEQGGILHRVSRNPHANSRTRVLAVVLHARDAKQLVVPESGVTKE